METELLACTNRDGEPDYILLIEVLQSNELHANQADDVFFRVGDKSKKLNFDERLQLMYAKGTRYFEDTPVPDAAMEDIDLDFVREYTQKLGYRKSPEEYLRENKDLTPPKVARKKSALPPCCCSARIRNTIFPAHASALSNLNQQNIIRLTVPVGAGKQFGFDLNGRLTVIKRLAQQLVVFLIAVDAGDRPVVLHADRDHAAVCVGKGDQMNRKRLCVDAGALAVKQRRFRHGADLFKCQLAKHTSASLSQEKSSFFTV